MKNHGRVENSERTAWWREARFGMFIHWGLYAVPAGVWKGKDIPSIGEWIMRNAEIPISEYEKLAAKFNPLKFNAEEWVKIAKQAGMKYMALTAKHHDGFCMFHSPCNSYNIVDATPYGKDIVKALAEACAKHGIKFCLYYSQSQDWHAPGGAGHWEEDKGRPWTSPAVSPEAFAEYLEEKVKPQLTEILTQYGPISVIWFDTPVVINKKQSLELRELVHKLQPACLVSGRVGNDAGDFGSLGDNEIPSCPLKGNWETPATFNDTWGYKRNDRNWKSVKDLLFLLSNLASKGVNYLLNVGPDASGMIPKPCVNRLKEIGKWMEVNGTAIYGSSGSPFPYDFEWGCMTQKGNKLYLLIMKWQASLTVNGLRNKIRKAKLLADPGRKLGIIQEYDAKTDTHSFTLSLGAKRPDSYVSVVELNLDGVPEADTMTLQQPDGSVILLPHMAKLHVAENNPTFGLTGAGLLQNWMETGNEAKWKFKLLKAGEYEVMIVISGPAYDDCGKPGKAGQKIALQIGNSLLKGTVKPEEKIEGPRTEYHSEYGCRIGRIKMNNTGIVNVTLKAEKIPADAWNGFPLASIRLFPRALSYSRQ